MNAELEQSESWPFEITVHNRKTGETLQCYARAHIVSMIGDWKDGEVWRAWSHIPKEHHERLCANTRDMVNDQIEHPTWVLAKQLREARDIEHAEQER